MAGEWATCARVVKCGGARVGGTDACLGHLDDGERGAYLSTLGDGATLDARGVTFDAGLTSAVVEAAPRRHGRPTLVNAKFASARFGPGVQLDGVSFEGGVSFENASFGDCASFFRATFDGVSFGGATFGDAASFVDATLGDDAYFDGATLGDHAYFDGATLGDHAYFDGATFGDIASFDRATFGHRASFDRATFGHRASFARATLGDHAYFDGATLGNGASFAGATFGDLASFAGAMLGDGASFTGATLGDFASFAGATFGNAASFDRATLGDGASFTGATLGDGASFGKATFVAGATFGKATFGDAASFGGPVFGARASFAGVTFGARAQFGPLRARDGLQVAGMVLPDPVRFAVEATRIEASSLRLPEGGAVDASAADAAFRDTRFGAATSVAVLAARDGAQAPPRLRVVSLERADVAHLTLNGVDLSACRFAGAHNLDRIRLEGDVRFARAPALLAGRARQAIAEEHALRASSRRRFRRRGWNPDACISPFHGDSEPLPPAYVATLYRALRKAREDTKDEPGAADFYYGEMEMRRMASPAASAERFLLTLYWLVSGYGLRASRALAALVVLVLAGGLLLHTHGVPSAWTLGDSLLFAVQEHDQPAAAAGGAAYLRRGVDRGRAAHSRPPSPRPRAPVAARPRQALSRASRVTARSTAPEEPRRTRAEPSTPGGRRRG